MSTPIYLQSSPHIRGKEDVRAVMYQVVLALVPGMVAAVIFFGARAALVLGVAAASVLAFEALFLRVAGKPVKEFTLDGSGLITALLLAMNLPSGIPVYMIVVGAFIAALLGKHAFGIVDGTQRVSADHRVERSRGERQIFGHPCPYFRAARYYV